MQAPFLDVNTLTRNWWVVLIRGIAVLFGFATFIAPGVSLAVLVLLFGAYALVDGVLAVVTALRRRDVGDRAWMFLLEGLVGIAAGVVTLVWPRITALALLYVIARLGVSDRRLRDCRRDPIAKDHYWRVAAGAQRHRLHRAGHLTDDFPGPGALVMVLWIGAYAFVFGVLLIALGARLRSLDRSRSPHAARAA